MYISISQLLPTKNFVKKTSNLAAAIKWGTIFLLLLCVFTRVCLYIFHKDLWLDEAMLFLAINETSWSGLLQGKLSYAQSAPLLFVLLNKIIISLIGTHVLYLYALPFICSLLSVTGIFLISKKIGDIFYVFSVMFFLSLCFTATYYGAEFKQYSTEMLISVILLYSMISSLKNSVAQLFSLKYILLYCVCVLSSSTSILFIAGLLCAVILIAWRRKEVKTIYANKWHLFIFVAFIIFYYFLYLKTGNSPAMKGYWKPYFIPLSSSAFLEYWKTTGLEIFQALFYSSKLTCFLLLGLACGSILLWFQRREICLLLSLPVVVTVGANFFFYPPGLGGAPHGGRLLLFLLPNALLVVGWFYAWLLRKCAGLAGYGGEGREGVSWLPPWAPRILFLCGLFTLVTGSAISSISYLCSREYYVEQIGELTKILQENRTPDSLTLIYNFTRCAYRYYTRNEPKHKTEILPLHLPQVLARLEKLPTNRRVLILFSHLRLIGNSGLSRIEELFTSQGRAYVKIPAKDAMLYILPKLN